MFEQYSGQVKDIIGSVKDRFGKKKKVLVVVGLKREAAFKSLFRNYEDCYCFEADPVAFEKLEEKYQKYPNVHLYNMAVDTYEGEVNYDLSENEDVSGPSHVWDGQPQRDTFADVSVDQMTRILCIHLYRFLDRHGVEYINDYISHNEGKDFEVLNTLKPLIDSGRIGTITCAVTKNGKHNDYRDLSNNSEIRYYKLLSDNYELIARGWGQLKDGVVKDVPDDWWEMDCKWRVKK
ncbi:MAG TPA: hypothetical protein VKA08_04320 [Balneolales bacterium]|nr:hypothetical protein [Balneolales bacterium]